MPNIIIMAKKRKMFLPENLFAFMLGAAGAGVSGRRQARRGRQCLINQQIKHFVPSKSKGDRLFNSLLYKGLGATHSSNSVKSNSDSCLRTSS